MGERPVIAGNVTSSSVPLSVPLMNEAAGMRAAGLLHKDTEPEGAKATARMLMEELRPTPVTLITVDDTPGMTVSGEKEEKLLTYTGLVVATGR